MIISIPVGNVGRNLWYRRRFFINGTFLGLKVQRLKRSNEKIREKTEMKNSYKLIFINLVYCIP